MQKALKALPGVKHVSIDFPTKVVVVSVEKTNKDDDQRFITALEAAPGNFGGTISDHGKPAK